MNKSAVVLLVMVMLAGTARASAPQWVEARSPHFTVVSDASEKQARHILDQLERMRWVFQTLFPKVNVDPAEPILVFAAKNAKTFQTVEPAPYLAKGQLNLAGYFLRTQDRNYVLLRLDAEEEEHPFATVYHEYTHLQFSSAAEWMPLWLNEGIAEFFQNTQIRDKDVLVGQPDFNNILYLRQQRLISLPVLFKVDGSSPYYHEEQKGSVFYAESWALTHYIQFTDREKGTHKLQDYIQLVSHHEDPVVAAEKVFGDLKEFQSELEDYIQRGQYKQLILNSAAAPIDESSYTTRSLTPIEADAARAAVLANVQREKEARDLIASILKVDPSNVQARETMGEIEHRSGNLDVARTWYGEAVKLDPKSYLANYYYASISMESGHIDDNAIEPCLRAAIQSNPHFAPAYERLAAYLGMHHENMDEALSLIKTAVKLDPGNYYFRLNAASVLAEMGDYKSAIAVAGAAVKLAQNPQQISQAQSQIGQIQQAQQNRAQIEQQQREYSSQQTGESSETVVEIVPVTEAPKHPAEASGPKHTLLGVIKDVTCEYPAVLEMRVESAGKTYNFYNNDFSKIDLTALGFVAKDSMNPCKDFEGLKARIQYAESSDKTVDGKVFAVELRK
ncbi:MAG: tetratricopeptide repeat protein [Terracidiphilus sp.]